MKHSATSYSRVTVDVFGRVVITQNSARIVVIIHRDTGLPTTITATAHPAPNTAALKARHRTGNTCSHHPQARGRIHGSEEWDRIFLTYVDDSISCHRNCVAAATVAHDYQGEFMLFHHGFSHLEGEVEDEREGQCERDRDREGQAEGELAGAG